MEPVDSKSSKQTTEAFSPTDVPISFSMAITNRLARTKSLLTKHPDNQDLKNYVEIYSGAQQSLISGTDSNNLRSAITIQRVLLVTELIKTMDKNRDAAATGFDTTPLDKLDKELNELKEFERRLPS